MKFFKVFEKYIQRSSDHFLKIPENQDSADADPQEHAFTRTIDEEAEMEEQAERDREEGHPEPEDEEEEREHEVMTAGSEYTLLALQIYTVAFFLVGKLAVEEKGKHFFIIFLKGSDILLMI